MKCLVGLLVGACFLAGRAPAARADLLFNVRLETSPLIGHSAEPFSLAFQLTDGSGAGDANNSAMISNFLFGGGSPAGSPTLTGGASGSLASTAQLTDSAFLTDFFQEFTPGSFVSFDVLLTTNVDIGGTPDGFSFAVLDKTNAELPTLGLGDVFLAVDIDSSTPTVQTFGSDPSRVPAGGGGALSIAAPTITFNPSTVVPEPATLILIASGLGVLMMARRRVN